MNPFEHKGKTWTHHECVEDFAGNPLDPGFWADTFVSGDEMVFTIGGGWSLYLQPIEFEIFENLAARFSGVIDDPESVARLLQIFPTDYSAHITAPRILAELYHQFKKDIRL